MVKAICLGVLIFLTIVMLASYPIAARYDLTWKEVLQKDLSWQVLLSLVLPHVSYSLYHCDGSLSVRLQFTFRWLSLPAFWVWALGLSPDWIDGKFS